MKTTAAAPTATQLTACESTEAAAALLPSALTRPQLNAVAVELGVTALGRFRTKADLVAEILRTAVGRRLDGQAILRSRTDRPIPADATNLRPAPTTAQELAALTGRLQATVAASIRRTTALILSGEVTDPAMAAELAAAAQALVAAASRVAVAAR